MAAIAKIVHGVNQYFEARVPPKERVSQRKWHSVSQSLVQYLVSGLKAGTWTMDELPMMLDFVDIEKSFQIGASNKTVQECLHAFKADVVNAGWWQRKARSQVNSSRIIEILGGSEKNPNHKHRGENIDLIMVENLNLKIPEDDDALSKMLPEAFVFVSTDNNLWTKTRDAWVVKLYYLKATGQTPDTDRCQAIWEKYSSWEKECCVNPQLSSLSFDTLSNLLPEPMDVLCQDDHLFKANLRRWSKEIRSYVIVNLNNFPFTPLFISPSDTSSTSSGTMEMMSASCSSSTCSVSSSQEAKIYRHNPYSYSASESIIDS
eukprot:TRINITY_DN7654_c1_g1_i1.p1 TRINITY_DN7654_c1_g1~~TRINITY_DN7654_c1_g1_i1.p1  ORF type:complete len:334 (+),score=64.47 TRINITY_DN7654_c1_g1_i1:49-1002(+)